MTSDQMLPDIVSCDQIIVSLTPPSMNNTLQDAQRVKEVYDKLNLAKTFRSAEENYLCLSKSSIWTHWTCDKAEEQPCRVLTM